jgi:hypothetical protein
MNAGRRSCVILVILMGTERGDRPYALTDYILLFDRVAYSIIVNFPYFNWAGSSPFIARVLAERYYLARRF